MNGSDGNFERAFLNEQKLRLAAEQLLKDKSTVLVAINNELQKKVADLEHQQMLFVQTEKMATLGTLCAGVAHEINTPLAYAMSNIESLQNSTPLLITLLKLNEQYLNNEIKESRFKHEIDILNLRYPYAWLYNNLQGQVNDSVEGLKRIKQIVHDLLNFAHPSSSQDKQLTDVTTGANNALRLLSNKLKLCEIKTRFEPLPLIWCNLSSINQIFVNLLMNAWQACELDLEKGCIIEVNIFELDTNICIEVKDNGCGMSEDTIAHMFDPFYTTKEVGEGTGMGMTLVYAMVSDHSGKIEVNSTLGTGTTIRCLLPLKA
ncbi:HAMP domain-containing histidine kinase [Pseudoalteromonas arctica]|uniref:sensor histidine kinase n=1 Tax=Pseudoalteromonas arctica TaxID=394751 RepID=UPI001C9CECDE|nr:HAMP domain-containing sensor histidine kinase [Pseudoalteromonas arctica]MBZ2193278.1 HAMP domain-containing histidine kinase [Pseudoalteromonas arctica]